MDNANNLAEVRNYYSDGDVKTIPSVLKTGEIGNNYYCVETKIKGEMAELYINNPEYKRVMTKEAANFLIELSQNSCKRVKVDNTFLKHYVRKPLERIRSFVREDENRAMLFDIENILSKNIFAEQIPIVLSHGDFKLENMRFDPSTKSLNGLFDWDLASKKSLPCFDLYNLFVSNKILIHNCSFEEAVQKTIFPLQFSDWEENILWDYYDRFEIPRRIERWMAFMYWACYIEKWITFNFIVLKKAPEILVKKNVSSLIPLFGKQFCDR